MCQIHFPDLDPAVVSCAACKHPTEVKVPKPDNWWITPSSGALVDQGEFLVNGLLEGTICPQCMGSRAGIGCPCSRNRIGSGDLADTADFLVSAVEASGFTPEEAGHIANSVFKRVTRRMELSDEELQDARNGLREEFGMKPKWLPPRTTEPTHLPV